MQIQPILKKYDILLIADEVFGPMYLLLFYELPLCLLVLHPGFFFFLFSFSFWFNYLLSC